MLKETLLEEENLTADTLCSAVRTVSANQTGYKKAMRKSGQMDSIETILQLIEKELAH